MNKMKEFAALFGLELYEEFNFKGISRPYRITERQMQYYDDSAKKWVNSFQFVLTEMLDGTLEVIKKPWKPKCGDMVCSYTKIGNCNIDIDWRYFNPNSSAHLAMYKEGVLFRTAEEAMASEDKFNELKKLYEEGV